MVTKQSMTTDLHSIVDDIEMDDKPLLGFALVLIRARDFELHFDTAPDCENDLSEALESASAQVLEEEDPTD